MFADTMIGALVAAGTASGMRALAAPVLERHPVGGAGRGRARHSGVHPTDGSRACGLPRFDGPALLG